MSTIQRISTFGVHQSLLGNVNNVQKNLFDLQKQISSGVKTDNLQGLASQVEPFTAIEAKIRRTETYLQQNSLVISRLNTTQEQLDSIIELADQAENLIIQRRNPATGKDLNFAGQMDNLKQTIAGALNETFEGRYLFGGTNTNTPPVIVDPSIPNPVSPGVPDDSYYQGSNENITVRAQDSYEFEYNVRADDKSFQQLFTAMALAESGDSADTDELLAAAQDMIQDALEGIIAVQTRVNSQIVSMENINQRHDELRLYWQGVREEIINTDIVAASTEVAIDQAILQASFQSFASINQLRLTDFL
jgi:flagellar hook-associated protein 3 FlgL